MFTWCRGLAVQSPCTTSHQWPLYSGCTTEGCNTADFYHMSELQSILSVSALQSTPCPPVCSLSLMLEATPQFIIISKAPQFDGKIGLW